MSEKRVKTRIVHKHDIAANWEQASNFVPKQGELVIYDDRTVEYDASGKGTTKEIKADRVRYKIGDGVNNINTLPFADTATTLNGLTSTVSELNYVDGVTSNIQTQLDGKSALSPVYRLDVAGTTRYIKVCTITPKAGTNDYNYIKFEVADSSVPFAEIIAKANRDTSGTTSHQLFYTGTNLVKGFVYDNGVFEVWVSATAYSATTIYPKSHYSRHGQVVWNFEAADALPTDAISTIDATHMEWKGKATTADSATTATTLASDETMKIYSEQNNEVNFGGSSSGSNAIYFGYRAKDSKSIPSKFVFGGTTGTSELVAAKFTGALNGNASTATKATQDASGNVITTTYATKSDLNSYVSAAELENEITLRDGADTALGKRIDSAEDRITSVESSYSGTESAISELQNDVDALQDKVVLANPYTTNDDGNDGLMSASDKAKLDNIAVGANNYTLPKASTTVLGGIKSGGDLTINNDGTASVNDNSHLHTAANISDLQSKLDAKVNLSAVGAKSGIASLDANGKVHTSQLPSYVDDVLEFDKKSDFPATGEAGKIYVDTATNITYRWGGTAYVEISASLALGETASTAYAGSKGAALATQVSGHASSISNLRADFSELSKSVAANTENIATNVSEISTLDGNLSSHTGDTSIHVASGERTKWNQGYTHSTTDHAPSNAEANVITSIKLAGTAATITSKSVNIPYATANQPGLMSSTHYNKVELIDQMRQDIDGNIAEINNKADSSHDHYYASSASIGGPADSALKLTTSAGSATNPIYFKDGKPAACTYTLNKSVPSDAKFTDTDTKNTAGVDDYQNTALYLIGSPTKGAASSNTTARTYTNNNLYVNGGTLYVGVDNPVLTAAEIESEVAAYMHSHSISDIANFPTSMTPTAHTHKKSDITDFPTIPTVNNGTLTIQKNGTNVATFSANQSSAATANITVPTKVSQLTNDSGYLTSSSTIEADNVMVPADTTGFDSLDAQSVTAHLSWLNGQINSLQYEMSQLKKALNAVYNSSTDTTTIS